MRKNKIFAFILAGAIALTGVTAVFADDIDNLRQEQAETQNDLSEVNNSIDILEDQKNEILGQIDTTEAQLVMIIASIDSLNIQIDEKNIQLEETGVQLGAAEERKVTQYSAMKKRIQYIYENGGDGGWATILLEENNITDLLNQAEFTQEMYSYDRKCLQEYAETVQQVTELQTQQQQEKAELISMQNEQLQQQDELNNILEELRATSSDFDSMLADAQEKANAYRELISQQNEQIQVLEAERARQEEEARRQAEEAARAQAEEEARRQQESQNNNTPTAPDNTPSVPDTPASGNDDNYSEPDPIIPNNPGSAEGQAVIDYALQFVGYPYVYGGNSLTNGTDCSGFTKLIYEAFGYSIPRSSWAQRTAGIGVSYSEAQPGDIICYDGHVALYIGGGAIVHASDEATGIKISGNATYRPIVAVRRIIY